MKRTSKFARLKLASVEKITIRSPIAKFFDAPPASSGIVEDGEPEPGPSTGIEEVETTIPKKKTRRLLETSDDFEEEKVRSFKKPPPKAVKVKTTATAPRQRTKKQPDIRKVLKINPELDYAEEQRNLQRMILQKSREENLNPDDLQLELAMRRSLEQDEQGDVKLTKRRVAIDFFDKLGMNAKTKRTRARKTAKGVTPLTLRDANKENEKIQSRIEEIMSRTLSADQNNSESLSAQEFPICSCFLYDLRVLINEKRIGSIDGQATRCEEVLDKFYVDSWLFPVSKIPSGYLLRDWSKIPGRSPSPESRQRVCTSTTTENVLEQEIAKELEEMNKQSAAFLENFEWRERSMSPDLFADLSKSAGSIQAVEDDEEEQSIPEEEEQTETQEEEVPSEESPVSIKVVDERKTIAEGEGDMENSPTEMTEDNGKSEEFCDLTQDSASSNEMVEILPSFIKESPIKTQQSVIDSQAFYDFDSVDAVLERARSLIKDLKQGEERETLQEEEPQNSPREKMEKIILQSISIIDSDEEEKEKENEAQPEDDVLSQPKDPGTSFLNNLNDLDWSKDQFSLLVRQKEENSGDATETEPNFPSPSPDSLPMDLENGITEENDFFRYSQIDFLTSPTATPCNDESPYDPPTQKTTSSDIIDLCEEDEEMEAEIKEDLKGVQFSQIPSKDLPKIPTQLPPSSSDVPLHQLIIRTDCVTPPPNYKQMPEEKLKKELQKFGIKSALPQPKAVKLLEHIYTQLHPLIPDDVDLAELQSNPLNETVRDLEQRLGVDSTVPLDLPGSLSQKLPSKSKSKVKSTCELPLPLAFKNRLRFDRKYHEKILQYQPIDLKELMSYFKSIGVRYDCNNVIELLDQHCITYRTVEQIRTGKNHKGGGE